MVRPKSTDTPAREKILRAASDLFFRQGYTQTGTNQLIAEAGVTKATFYAHFPSKVDLAVAYVKRNAALSMRMIHDRIDQDMNPWDRYLSFFQSVTDYMISTDFRGCSFTNIAREFPDKKSPVRIEVVAFETAYRDGLRDAVRILFESEPDHFAGFSLSVDEVTDRYYLMLEGALAAAANFHDTWPLTVAARAIRDLVGRPDLTLVVR